MFNAIKNDAKQHELEDWIKEAYPAVWDGLEKIGIKTNAFDGIRRVKIERTLTP